MKKYLAIMLALICVFTLCACGGEDKPAPTDEGNAGNTVAEPDYGELYYESKGVKFGIFDKAEETLAALGEPQGSFEDKSCAYQGQDYFYYYDGFEVMANDIDGVRRISGITVADDTVKTPQGLKIGMKLEEALELMSAVGVPHTEAGDIHKFLSGSTMLRLRVGDDGTLAAIEYSVAANEVK